MTYFCDDPTGSASIVSSHPQKDILSADIEIIMTIQQVHNRNFLPRRSTSRTVTADVIIINTDDTTLAFPDHPAALKRTVA
jgi:hypothetical protein